MDSRDALFDARCGNADLIWRPFLVVCDSAMDAGASSSGSTFTRKAVARLSIS